MSEPALDLTPLEGARDDASAEQVARATSVMGEWYRQHGRAVYNYFRFLGAVPDEADDLTAETFLRAIRAQAVYDSTRASARTWLCRIAHNAWCDTVRRAKRSPVGG